MSTVTVQHLRNSTRWRKTSVNSANLVEREDASTARICHELEVAAVVSCGWHRCASSSDSLSFHSLRVPTKAADVTYHGPDEIQSSTWRFAAPRDLNRPPPRMA